MSCEEKEVTPEPLKEAIYREEDAVMKVKVYADIIKDDMRIVSCKIIEIIRQSRRYVDMNLNQELTLKVIIGSCRVPGLWSIDYD